ncbi:inner membrane protein YhjD [Escherichia coli]|nr:inner membrane protein YhjD [Escherichia coli]
MTQENEIKRPTQDLEHEPIKQLDNSEKGGKVSQALETVTTTAEKVQRQPVIAHLIRATERFNDRLGNLREAIRAQSRDVWERSPQDQEKFWVKYLRDFISLIGLLIALIVTLSITSVAGSAQQMIISALHLNSIEWLKPTWRLIGLAISIFANYLLFFWIFWRLPRHRPRKKALIRGTFLAAIGFEVIKIVMTYTLPSLMKSPSGAAFGSVLGLMAFFYFFARLTLFCAAWIATAEYKDDPRMPGKTQP